MPIDNATQIFVIDWSSIIDINRLIDIDYRFHRLQDEAWVHPRDYHKVDSLYRRQQIGQPCVEPKKSEGIFGIERLETIW